MQYVLSFLEGILTFISPCLLPMLPVYVSYFTGGSKDGDKQRTVLFNSVGFVLGFTIIFVIIGAFAASAGMFFLRFGRVVDVVTGLVVVLFGLNYMGVLKLGLFNFSNRKLSSGVLAKPLNFSSAFIFGAIFSIAWTPCVGAFLGAALVRASQSGSVLEGMLMLFVYAMGLGIPLIVSAVLLHKLKSAFAFIQRHYRIINIISGMFLVLVGILMMTGWFGVFLRLFTM